MDDRYGNEGDKSRNREKPPWRREEEVSFSVYGGLCWSFLSLFYFYYLRGGEGCRRSSFRVASKTQPCLSHAGSLMSQQATGQLDSTAQSHWTRAVFGHTHFTNPDSDFLKNHLYVTWCLTSELASKTVPPVSTKEDSGSNVEALSFSSVTDEHNWIRACFFLHGQLLFLSL